MNRPSTVAGVNHWIASLKARVASNKVSCSHTCELPLPCEYYTLHRRRLRTEHVSTIRDVTLERVGWKDRAI